MRLGTKNHNSARQTLGRLIRSYHRGEMDSQTFRDLIYGMNAMLAYYRFDADLEIAKRLEIVEEAILKDQVDSRPPSRRV